MIKLDYENIIKVKDGCIDLGSKKLQDSHIEGLVKLLAQSQNIKTLILSGNKITLTNGKFAKALAHNRTLLVLNLHNNNIGNEGAKSLSDALKVNQTLEKLHLGNNHIGQSGRLFPQNPEPSCGVA